jgi:hypothetical protein
MAKILYMPDVLQFSDYDCGDTCVQAIMAYYGTDLNEIQLLKKLKTRKTTGTGVEHIEDFFKKQGFKVESRSMDINYLKNFIKKKIPVIILAQAWKKSPVKYKRTKAFGHYMIVVGIDDKKVYLEDPAIFGHGYIPVKEFIKRWHAEDHTDENLIRHGIAVWGKKPYNFKKLVRIK